MKGKNVLKINAATMTDMVQHYLNDHVLSKDHQVKVTNVAYDGLEHVFTVDTSEPETEKPNSGSTGS